MNYPYRAPSRRLLVPLLVFMSASCGSEPRGAPTPQALNNPAAHVVHIGLDESTIEATIGRVVAARMTDQGRHVVVLDFVAPFIKVFDGRGRFQTAFLRRGGGPGESRGPVALAVGGDSLVLVANSADGVSVYTLRGEQRAHARVPGLVPLAATSWCGGEWLVYGPRIASGAGMRAPWLHRVRAVSADSFEIISMLPDTVPPALGEGMVYGLVREGEGAVLRHAVGTRARVLRAPCAGGQPRLVYEGGPEGGDEAPKDLGGGRVTTSIRTGMRFPGGLAAVGGKVVAAEKVYLGEGQQRLDFTLISGEGAEPAGSFSGNFALRDSHPDVGVLVSTTDPVPQLFIVRPREFLQMLEKP